MTLPEATASTGSPSITYTLSPILPNGLSFDASTRTVSGTPTAAATSASYTYTAVATDYTSPTLPFSIVVAEPVVDGSSSVTATRINDGTSASVSWTKYNGNAFDYYQVVVCTDAQYDGSSCTGTVFKSGAIYGIDSTGPVSVTGLDAADGYGVIHASVAHRRPLQPEVLRRHVRPDCQNPVLRQFHGSRPELHQGHGH